MEWSGGQDSGPLSCGASNAHLNPIAVSLVLGSLQGPEQHRGIMQWEASSLSNGQADLPDCDFEGPPQGLILES